MEKILLSRINHKGQEVLKVRFPYNGKWIELLKKVPGSRWSRTMGSWYVQDSEGAEQEIVRLFKGVAFVDCSGINKMAVQTQPIQIKSDRSKRINAFHERSLPDEVSKVPDTDTLQLSDDAKFKIEKYKQWLRSRRYSESTVKTYTDALQSFLRFYSHKSISEINNNDVIVYNNEFILKNKLSASYQNQVVNAIKLFFREMENTAINVDIIHRPKRPKLLPNVLSKEEVKDILNALKNIKHKMMLSLIYSCGLRRGELLNLKITAIDSKRNLIIIKQAKGRKDRIAPLSEKITTMLREYYKIFKPQKWLFEGQKKGEKYSEKSLESVLKQALAKTKIKKPVSLHWLRHSYATHLLENGTDLRYIQEILGHKSSRTTEMYTHVSTKSIQNIKSPFDDLDI